MVARYILLPYTKNIKKKHYLCKYNIQGNTYGKIHQPLH